MHLPTALGVASSASFTNHRSIISCFGNLVRLKLVTATRLGILGGTARPINAIHDSTKEVSHVPSC